MAVGSWNSTTLCYVTGKEEYRVGVVMDVKMIQPATKKAGKRYVIYLEFREGLVRGKFDLGYPDSISSLREFGVDTNISI